MTNVPRWSSTLDLFRCVKRVNVLGVVFEYPAALVSNFMCIYMYVPYNLSYIPDDALCDGNIPLN
jgi:hypothetical protein